MLLSVCQSCTAASLNCESTESMYTYLQHSLLVNGQVCWIYPSKHPFGAKSQAIKPNIVFFPLGEKDAGSIIKE